LLHIRDQIDIELGCSVRPVRLGLSLQFG
jgi:hypothetical protein